MRRVGLAISMIVVLLSCGSTRLFAASAFFQVHGSTNSRIIALDRDGWMTWSNAAVMGTSTVMRTLSLLSPAEWMSVISVPVTSQVLSAQVLWPNMVEIAAGSFSMGNCMDLAEGEPNEIPVHTVSVSALWMELDEVSFALWDRVAAWGRDHGYQFSEAALGKSPSHPVVNVSWYDAVKWCNARSQMEGLTPCYYMNADTMSVYTNGDVDLSGNWVRWNADGYRLPTEVEWEYAARGGVSGHRFPWSDVDTIDHGLANYWSYWEEGRPYISYDEASEEGYHPAYTNGVEPFTGPVGSLGTNGFGLCDMAGNVREWCWDWYEEGWYAKAEAAADDTRGPDAGVLRVVRGGGWNSDAFSARCSARFSEQPVNPWQNCGFRCVRRR